MKAELRRSLLKVAGVLLLSLLVYWLAYWWLKVAFLVLVAYFGAMDRDLASVRRDLWKYIRSL
jgi:hypothetical protein